MANVFLSYASEDGTRAALIAQALIGQGWTVWWDRTIAPGRTFDDVIEDALEDASCVVVLWSKASIASHWVRAEAAEGMRRGILVPAFLENVRIPLEFRRIQSANLRSWDGSPNDPKFDQFLQSVAMLMQPTTIGPVPNTAPPIPAPSFDTFDRTPPPPPLLQTLEPDRPRVLLWTIGIAIAVAITGLLGWQVARSWRPGAVDAGSKTIEKAPAPSDTEASAPAVPEDPRRDVPSVIGTTLDEARAQLERTGLSVGNVRETIGAGTVGTIAAQRPAAGERVSPGSAIDLVVVAAPVAKSESVRPQPKPKAETRAAEDSEVPALTGLAIDVAKDRVVRRGLSVGRITVRQASPNEMDLVLAQDPAPGTRQPRGTAVSLTIGGGK